MVWNLEFHNSSYNQPMEACVNNDGLFVYLYFMGMTMGIIKEVYIGNILGILRVMILGCLKITDMANFERVKGRLNINFSGPIFSDNPIYSWGYIRTIVNFHNQNRDDLSNTSGGRMGFCHSICYPHSGNLTLLWTIPRFDDVNHPWVGYVPWLHCQRVKPHFWLVTSSFCWFQW